MAGTTAPLSLTGLPVSLTGLPAALAAPVPGPRPDPHQTTPAGVGIPGPGSPGWLTSGNSRGLYAGYWVSGAYSTTGFLWRDGTVHVLNGSTAPKTVTEDGVVIGDFVSHYDRQAFRLEHRNPQPQRLGYLGGTQTAGGYSSTAAAVNCAGVIVGTSTTNAGTFHAFRWADSHLQDLGTLGGPGSSAVAVTSAGAIAGSSDTAAGPSHAFLWRRGTLHDLGTLGGPSSSAVAANDAGQIVGYSDTADGHTHAFRWERGRLIDLGTLPGDTDSSAIGINNVGQVLVRSRGSSSRAFVWQHGQRATISVPTGDLEVTAINDRGTVAGTANGHAFRWRNGRFTDLGTLGGPYSYASAITPTDVVLGSSVPADSPIPLATFWPAPGPRPLTRPARRFRSGWTMSDGWRPRRHGGPPAPARTTRRRIIMSESEDIAVHTLPGHVAVVEVRRPPHNFFEVRLIQTLADIYDKLDADSDVRAVVLCSQGRNFCAGADFSGASAAEAISADEGAPALYREALRLFASPIPVVAAVQGSAVGGGLGLALSADFRVASPDSRFAANFSRIGLHQGFGISVTLPAVVGRQKALDLLYTGRRVGGQEAFAIGLADRLVPNTELREAAVALAGEITAAAPLAVRSIRETMWADLVPVIRAATERETAEQ
ncbi:enoyl-CoA hydratase-related protein, partial [Frankia sp. CcWB2]